MSRAYRIRVSSTVEKVIHVDDGICSPLELLPILPSHRMKGLLGHELEERGFTLDGNIAQRKEGDGVIIEIDIEKGEIALRIETEQNVKATAATQIIRDKSRADHGRARVQDKLKGEAKEKLEQAQEDLQRQATENLEGRLGDIRSDLDQIINKVTAEALKERARQLGEVEEIQEDQETGSLTIKVKL